MTEGAKILKVRGEGIEIHHDDLWYHKYAGQIISHRAVMRIARELGLKVLKSELLVAPTIDNEMTIQLNCGVRDTNGLEYWTIGEASYLNCPPDSPGRSYLGSMAEKRGRDKAILATLELDIYSEFETEEFQEGKPKGGNNQKPKVRGEMKKASTKTGKEVKQNNGKGGGNGNKINGKVLEKIEEISEELEIEPRMEFNSQEEAIEYLNDLLRQFRESQVQLEGNGRR